MEAVKTFPAKLISFLKEVQFEVKKVKWPSRDETLRFTVVVILFSAAVALFLAAWDWIFQFILKRYL